MERMDPEEVFTSSFDEFKEMFHVKHFIETLNGWNIDLTDRQLWQFYLYYRELVKWNQVMNLTAITELPEVLEKHFVDSLSIIKTLPKDYKLSGKVLIDVGTGAGFPGLPLAIVFPEMSVVLMDSLAKRIGFLDKTVSLLGLNNVTTIHSRAEDLARQKDQRETYDIACSRAVAELRCLSEYCLPFVKEQGYFVAYKSEKADEEISNASTALKILGGRVEDERKFILPGTEYGRTLVLIRKEKRTPIKYPRKAGVPSKEPL